MKISVSAPGKLMLMGEHAVVYGYNCLVTAVDHRLKAGLENIETSELIFSAPDLGVTDYRKSLDTLGQGEIPKEAKFVELSVANFQARYGLKTGLKITTQSDFKATFGFGSSSAATVCTIGGLSKLFDINLSLQEIFELAYKTVLDVQGKGSGFDIAVATLGGTLYYGKAGKVMERLNLENLPLVVGYTGKKYGTVQVLDEVLELAEKFPEEVQDTYFNISKLTEKAVNFLRQNELTKFGQMMNFNQGELERLGVNSLELSEIIYAARNNGALGSKLSGAGKGDCAISLVNSYDFEMVSQAIQKAGFEVIPVRVNAEGLRVEK